MICQLSNFNKQLYIFGKFCLILVFTAVVVWGAGSSVFSASSETPSASLVVGIRIYPADWEDENEIEPGPPRFLVDRPAVVIKAAYSQDTKALEINEHLQKNMLVRWHNKTEPKSSIKFKSENLVLIGQSAFSPVGGFFGSTAEESNPTSYIPAEAILMKKSDSAEYENMKDFRVVLAAEEDKSELEFKLDENLLVSSEIQVKPGIYRGDIISNYSLFGRSPHILVQVENSWEKSKTPTAPGVSGRNIRNLPANNKGQQVADILADLVAENILCDLYLDNYNVEVLTYENFVGNSQELELPEDYRIIHIEIYQGED